MRRKKTWLSPPGVSSCRIGNTGDPPVRRRSARRAAHTHTRAQTRDSTTHARRGRTAQQRSADREFAASGEARDSGEPRELREPREAGKAGEAGEPGEGKQVERGERYA